MINSSQSNQFFKAPEADRVVEGVVAARLQVVSTALNGAENAFNAMCERAEASATKLAGQVVEQSFTPKYVPGVAPNQVVAPVIVPQELELGALRGQIDAIFAGQPVSGQSQELTSA